MLRELAARGLRCEPEVPINLEHRGSPLETKFYIDLLVEDKVVVELKAIEMITPVHEAQLLTYMKLSHKRVGLLFNFNVAILRKGIVRRVL